MTVESTQKNRFDSVEATPLGLFKNANQGFGGNSLFKFRTLVWCLAVSFALQGSLFTANAVELNEEFSETLEVSATDGIFASVFEGFKPPKKKKPETIKGKECKKADWKGVDEVEGVVTRSVDGDTVRVMMGKIDMPIRMLSIDTPETNFQGKSQGVWADKAKDKLAKLLPVKTKVTIELEAEKCDANGRMLGHVWKGNLNVNRAMVESALAVMYCIYPNESYCSDYGALSQEAHEARKGMFGDKSLELPYEWRRLIRKEPLTKYVGDLASHWVLKPELLEEVDLGSRIFFFAISDIELPYELEE